MKLGCFPKVSVWNWTNFGTLVDYLFLESEPNQNALNAEANLTKGIAFVQLLRCSGLSCTLMDKIGTPLVIAFLGLYRSKMSSLLLGRLYHFCGVVFLWLLMWFSKLTTLHFPWLQNSLLEMWAHLSQNIALLGKAKWMKIITSWLEMQLLESFLMFFYSVPEKKSAVLELFGCCHLQCIVAITEPFRKCFLKYRFALGLEVQICTIIFHFLFFSFHIPACVRLKPNTMVFWQQNVYSTSRESIYTTVLLFGDVGTFRRQCFYRAEIVNNQETMISEFVIVVCLFLFIKNK